MRVLLIAALLVILNLGNAQAEPSKKDIETVNKAIDQVAQLYRSGKYNEALALARKTLTQAEKLLGKDHPDTLSSINNLAFLYQAQGRYALAEPLYKRALEASERVLGKEHPDTLLSVNNLAGLYYTQGRYALAEPLYKRALEARERVLGKEHPRTLTSVNNLAGLYESQGRYALSEPLYKRALEARERVLGKEHPDTLTSVNNLAALYRAQGRYALSEPLYKRALEASERVLGKEHPDTLGSVNNLAELYSAQGRYALAEPLYKRALEAQERVLGKEHPQTLSSVNNLAFLYQAQGRTALAEPLYKRALEARERVLGKEHPDTLRSVNNLAFLYRAQGRTALAEPLYKRALEARERVLGKEHPDTLQSVNNLALLYYTQGRYALAEPLYKRALETQERVLGKEHPQTLISVNNLAGLYDTQGQYALAEPLYKRALEARERVLGKEHPQTLSSVNNLAGLYYGKQDWPLATTLYDRGTSGYARRAEFAGGTNLTGQKKTEAQRKSFAFQVYLKAAYRAQESQSQTQSNHGLKTFSRLQWTQGAGASAALSQMAVRVGAGSDRLARLVRERQDLVEAWKKLETLLDKALGRPTKKRNADQEKALRGKLQTIEKRIQEIDATFSKDFPDYADLANPKPLSVAQVQQQLRDDEALVYIVDTPKWRKTEEESFIWVVTKTDMKWVRSKLGTEVLTRMVKMLRCGLDGDSWRKGKVAAECNRLLKTSHNYYGFKSSDDLPFRADIAYALYDGLFGQVKDLIKGKKLLIVPSGPLTSLPFQVLLTKKPRPFVDYSARAWLTNDHEITVLPSVASLKALRRTSKPSLAERPFFGVGNPLLLGEDGNDRRAWKKQDCSFTRKPKPLKVAGWTVPEGIAKYFRGGVVNVDQLRRVAPLPETAYELCAVARLLGAGDEAVILGAKATEGNIKDLSADGTLKQARIIHFATHGLLAGETEEIFKVKAEPALVLTPPTKVSDKDDGLLTASEITQLKLDADWVILSACNTAAGDKPGAEPMSGMAKAFFYAGARALLVSHWAVNSDATVTLITSSLKAQKDDPKLGRAGALRVAMQKMIQSKDLSHPAYWAPFVVVGEGSYTGK